MAIRRLVKTAKLVNKQMLLMNRREPYKPRTADRHLIEDRVKLEQMEQYSAQGLVFVPDAVLPPWKKSIMTNLHKQKNQLNFRGMRVRVVDRQDEPGFPTHFR